MTIYFDIDGTIADFYGVEDWLSFLIAENPLPYAIAKPRINMSSFARIIHKLQKKGYNVGIISWLSKGGSDAYNDKVTEIKKKWLKKHCPSVKFDKIYIIEYGTPKHNFMNCGDVLFDDEEKNRTNWEKNNGISFDVNNIIEILKNF